MDHDAIRELLPALALGALEEPESLEVLAHLEACDECRPELAAFEGVATGLLEASPAVAPPGGLKERVMRAALSRPSPGVPQPRAAAARPRGGAREWLGWGLAIATGAVLLAVLPRPGREAAELRRAGAIADSLRGELQVRVSQLAESRKELELFNAPDFRLVSLAAQPLTREASARVVYSARLKRARLYVENLKAPPQGRTYEVWLLARDAPPIPSGVFRPDPAGAAELEFPPSGLLGSAVAFTVTLEPGPFGGPAPTGAKVLVGLVK